MKRVEQQKRQSAKPEISQLHRLEGQLHGIEKMLEQNVKVDQVLQQIEAVRGNLKSLEKRLLKAELSGVKDKALERCFDYLCKIS